MTKDLNEDFLAPAATLATVALQKKVAENSAITEEDMASAFTAAYRALEMAKEQLKPKRPPGDPAKAISTLLPKLP